MTPLRARLIAAVAALIGLAACSGKAPMDDALKNDLAAVGSGSLELAPSAAHQQMVVSAVEGGPESAPAPAAHKLVTRPSSRPTIRVAAHRDPAPAPAPAPREVAEAPSAPAPQPAPTQSAKAAEPPPLPPATRAPAQRQRGTYSTEAQVFQQMPWIKP